MKKIPTTQNRAKIRKKKTYLYHWVPPDMQGTVLYSLNSLKDIHPKVYLSQAEKYDDRKYLMEQFIPTLKCAWNDVIHFSAIDPLELKKTLVEAGMEPKEMKFYQIEPGLLDPRHTTIYLYPGREDAMNPKNFTDYDPKKLEVHSILLQVTKNYYKDKISKGEKPFYFVRVPHILYLGSVDISHSPIIIV